MKIIQQNFVVYSKGWFIFFFLATLLVLYCYVSSFNEGGVWWIVFSTFASTIMFTIGSYCTYYYSFKYEFKETKIIATSLFRFWKHTEYHFDDLVMIEFLISTKGVIDTINLKFNNLRTNRKLSILVDIGKVKLFLFSNVKNFETLIVEKERRWGR